MMSNNDVKKSDKAESDKKRILELMLKKKGIVPRNESKTPLIPARMDKNDLALSNAQQRLWFLEELTTDTVAYVFCNRVDLRGTIDLSVLSRAYQEIVNRHEIMRTSYHQKDGIPSQTIHQNIVIDIPLIDLQRLSGSDCETRLQEVINTESKKPFDMKVAPLMRMCIVRLSNQHHVVLQTIHHIVYDGWSLAVIYDELASLYEAFLAGKENPLSELDIQYADYTSWQRGVLDSSAAKEKMTFWKQNLSGHLPVLELPIGKSRPSSQSYNGALHRIKYSAGLTSALNGFAARHDCTVFMLLMTAFKVLLHRYTGETDIIIGTPVANRNYHQIEKLIGLFVNSLVLRTSLEDDPDVQELLSRVRTTASNAFANQEVPFEKIVDELKIERDISHNPIFQVMFAFQNTPDLPDKIGEAELDLEILDNDTSVFDITLNLHDSQDGIYGYIEYCSDLFDAQAIERMAGHYQNILESMISRPASRISELQLMGSDERNQILGNWNQVPVSYDSDKYVHQLIEEQARINPEGYSLCHSGRRVTYTQLNEQSNQLARHLKNLGIGAGTIVGLCVDRSIEMFIGILGILKAGGAYLPLDPEYPNDRLSFMIEDTNIEILVTKNTLIGNLPNHNTETVCLDSDWDKIKLNGTTNLDESFQPENIAYIIYTSGSTGKPKGVLVTHRNLLHSTRVRQAYYSDPVRAFLLMSSFSFDSSVAGIFWTFCDGGMLVLPEEGQQRDIFQVANLVQEHSISHMLSLPSVYSVLLDNANPGQLSSLNAVCVAGEECPSVLIDQHFKIMHATRLYNEYGPTEGTVWSTVYECRPDQKGKTIPIGKAVPNVKIYILDNYLNPVTIGVIGEIYIGGDGVTRGYLNRPDLTADKYISDPFSGIQGARLYKSGDLGKYRPDGNIDFLGRIDHQVKIRGYRIELGEIETALSSHEGIKDVVVIARQRKSTSESPQLLSNAEDVDLILSKLVSMTDDEADRMLSEVETLSDSQVKQSI